MKHPASLALCALCAMPATLSACSSQVDPEYRGEPLAVISGAVSADDVGVDGLVPVLGWYNFGREDHSDGDTAPVLLHEVEVDGEFPNRFTMRVYDLPPEGAATPPSDGEPPVAIAMIFAANPDADWSEGFGDSDDLPQWLAGAAANYMVVYIDGQTRDDGPAAGLFGQPLGKGYHLVEVHALTTEQRAARVACQDEGSLRALASYNEMYGTSYGEQSDVPLEDLERYTQLQDAEINMCGGKISMKVVRSGLDHPVQLQIGRDLEFIDWT